MALLPAFEEGAQDAQNVETLRLNFEYFLGEELGFDERIRVDSDIVSAVSPLFPWNEIDRDSNGMRFLWPLQSPSNSPVIVEQPLTSTPSPSAPPPALPESRMGLPESNVVQVSEQMFDQKVMVKQVNAVTCAAQQCAAKVVVWSAKFVRWQAINNAYKKIAARPSFDVVFNTDRSKIKIIREGKTRFAVFIPLISRSVF